MHLTLQLIGRSLTTSGLYVVRSGACTTLRRAVAYLLLLWLDFTLTVQLISDCCPVVAKNTSCACSPMSFVGYKLRVGHPKEPHGPAY